MPSDDSQHDTVEPNANQLDDAIENHVDDVQKRFDEARESVEEQYQPDLEHQEDHLEDVEDAIDDAQDGEGENPLGPLPATLNYLQHTAGRLAEQSDAAQTELDQYRIALEALEDALSFVEVERTRWFALVDGVPGLHTEPTPEAGELVRQSKGEDANVDRFTVRAYTSEADDEPDATFTRPDEEADLEQYRHFRTEADKDGGPV